MQPLPAYPKPTLSDIFGVKGNFTLIRALEIYDEFSNTLRDNNPDRMPIAIPEDNFPPGPNQSGARTNRMVRDANGFNLGKKSPHAGSRRETWGLNGF